MDKLVKKHQDGAIFNIFVTSGAKTINFPAGFNKWRNCIEIKVSAPARDNKANKDVIKTVANFFEKSINDVLLISGTKNRTKTVYIKETSVNFISEKLKESLDGL